MIEVARALFAERGLDGTSVEEIAALPLVPSSAEQFGAGAVTIGDVAELVRRTVGFKGELRLDTTKPDGTPRKLMDVSRLARLGWQARISLQGGLQETYAWFLAHLDAKRT